jgi:hypothetical protein
MRDDPGLPVPSAPTGAILKPSLQALGRIGLAVLLTVSVASFLFIIGLELAGFSAQAVQIDENYFSACAVRGLEIGALPVAACHDNKAPLIFTVYELVFAAFGAYNFVAVKIAAYALVLLNVALLASIAFRLAGHAAAILAGSLLLLCLTSDIGNMALKTELIGGLFVSGALLLLSAPQACASTMRLALAGLLVGLAVVTKQPYGFVGFAVIAWLFLSIDPRPAARAGRFLKRSMIFGASVLVPFALFWLSFAVQGNATDFLLSFFLYPVVYGANHVTSLAGLARRIATVVAAFSDHMLLVGAAAAAAAALILAERSSAPGDHRFADPRWLFLSVVAFLVAALIATPMWLPYHIVLIAGPMALLAGTVLGDSWRRAWRLAPQAALCVLAAINAAALASAAETWRSDGRRYDEPETPVPPMMPVHASPTARYAFQLGQQPQFYALGGFIPASSVQFPWALPGTPENWSYTKPQTGTITRRILDTYQARNLAQLYADFARTPPSYIVLQSNYAGTANAPDAVDIPGFQTYLDLHCRLRALDQTAPSVSISFFDCTTASKAG